MDTVACAANSTLALAIIRPHWWQSSCSTTFLPCALFVRTTPVRACPEQEHGEKALRYPKQGRAAAV